MKTNLYKITLILLAFIMSNAAFAQVNLLYVGKTDNTADSSMLESLDPEVFSVTSIDISEFTGTAFSGAPGYAAYDAIFISDVVSSSQTLNFKEAGFPIPCVTNEGWAVRSDKWGFLTDDDAQFIQLSGDARTAGSFTMNINDVDHWIANLYAPDYKLLWTYYPDSLAHKIGVTGFNLDENIDGAVEIGFFLTDSLKGLPSIWAIPEGSSLVSDGTVLPNMVIIGTVAAGLGQNATEEYNRLIEYSLRWVTGETDIESISNVQHYNLNVWPNPTNGIVNVSFTLPVSGNVRVYIYDIAGKLMVTIDSDYLTAGYNTINLDFSNMAEAHYIYEIITKNDILRGKICKIK